MKRLKNLVGACAILLALASCNRSGRGELTWDCNTGESVY